MTKNGNLGLEAFFPPRVVKPKEILGIDVIEHCSNPRCRVELGVEHPKYVVRIKGKDTVYCRDCARQVLPKPKPITETKTVVRVTEDNEDRRGIEW